MKKPVLEYFTEKEQLILKNRAREMALKKEVSIKSGIEFLICQLSSEYYGFETKYMQEVFLVNDITPLPSTPDWLLGIVNARGEIISVIDLRHFFDLKGGEKLATNKILILSYNEMKFGILIDTIFDIITVAEDDLTKEFITFDKVRKEYLKGITDENYILLDAYKILTDPKLIIHEEI